MKSLSIFYFAGIKFKNAIYFFLILFTCFYLNNKSALAVEKNNLENNLKEYKDNSFGDEINTDYLLGPGDKLSIKFTGVDIFTNLYNIDPKGFLNLPEINKVYAEYKTIEELQKLLIEKYSKYIINPEISLKIVYFRPVNVFVKGEVKTPGLYTLYYSKNDRLRVSEFQPSKNNQLTEFPSILEVDKFNFESNIFFPPKLFDALKISKGITNYADLSNIKVIRNNSESQGGGKISTELNFLELLRDGNQDNNIDLNDGDIIVVGKTKKLIKEQILAINKTNITPDKITVFISGNVQVPGTLVLDQGSSLVQAIYSAGGEKYFTGTINHIRFNEEKNSKKSSFLFNANAPVNSKSNPILLNGDIINVNKTLLGKTSNAIKEVAVPIITTNAILNIFE